MTSAVKIINLGGVNCYLAKTDVGYILIDTGFLSKRAKLEQELAAAGCRPGNLNLIILTHGDTDHADNAAYLREKYGAKIALHPVEAPVVERGDMSCTRKAKPDKIGLIGSLWRRRRGLAKSGQASMSEHRERQLLLGIPGADATASAPRRISPPVRCRSRSPSATSMATASWISWSPTPAAPPFRCF